ncbi:MAG: hypothetical protein AABX11_01490 [Nanoarchaeota archaeon]
MSKELSDLTINFLELIQQEKSKKARALFLQHTQEIRRELYSRRFISYQNSLPEVQRRRFTELYLLYTITYPVGKRRYSPRAKSAS